MTPEGGNANTPQPSLEAEVEEAQPTTAAVLDTRLTGATAPTDPLPNRVAALPHAP